MRIAPSSNLPLDWVEAPRLALWPDGVPGGDAFKAQSVPSDSPIVFVRNVDNPELRVFPAKRPNGAAILVIPGGGYTFVSIDNEGVQIAARLTALGYYAFVLTYRLPSEGWRNRADVPLADARQALRVIWSRAGHYGIDPSKVAALGFSAGGHLAATLATDRKDAEDMSKLAAVGLIYPVITMGDRYTHVISRARLLGEKPTQVEVERRSPERHISSTTPPIFLAHAIDDSHVPVENSLMMLSAMRVAKRPVEAHFFQEGEHAFASGYAGTPTSLWIATFALWLKRLGLG
jgi:acetyl esterase/lipase